MKVPFFETLSADPCGMADSIAARLRRSVLELELADKRIKFVNCIQSVRDYVNKLKIKRLVPQVLDQRLSEPALLQGSVAAETIALWQAERRMDSLNDGLREEDEDDGVSNHLTAEAIQRTSTTQENNRLQNEVRLRRALSFIQSPEERDAVALCRSKELEVEQEESAEALVPRKFAYWNYNDDEATVDVHARALEKDDFYMLEFVLRFNYPVRTMSLSRCFVTNDNALGIVRALRYNFVVQSLNLSGTRLTDTIVLELAEALHRNPTLTVLDLRQVDGLTESGAARLFRLFRDTPSLEVVNGLPLRDLERNPPTDLSLSNKLLRATEAVLLIRALASVQNLASLVLSSNEFDDRATATLVAIVKTHPRLSFLDLDNNRIGPVGLKHIVNCIEGCPWLTSLSLASNNIVASGFDTSSLMDLLCALRLRNTTLTALNVAHNNVPQHLQQELDARTSVNRALLHNQRTFETFLDDRFKPGIRNIPPDGGYELTLKFDPDFIRHEREERDLPVLLFDDDDGDDYELHPCSRSCGPHRAAKTMHT